MGGRRRGRRPSADCQLRLWTLVVLFPSPPSVRVAFLLWVGFSCDYLPVDSGCPGKLQRVCKSWVLLGPLGKSQGPTVSSRKAELGKACPPRLRGLSA